MKIALVTTTVHVPKVLQLYRKLDPDVVFFVAGDRKTPLEAKEFCGSISDCNYLTPQYQERYRSSEAIGWNTDSRRNIAVLEALKWGADVVISADDDMIPLTLDWGRQFAAAFDTSYDGIQFGVPRLWFDAGRLTVPIAKQRGIPFGFGNTWRPSFVTDAKIGMVQGIILGVPDTNATMAIEQAPVVHSASDILRSSFVFHRQAFAVVNSQWTAFRAELAPAFMQHYKTQQRNTDIFASLLMRRLMVERDLYTYFGPPPAFHAREPRPLIGDLKAEMYGQEHIGEWADYLYRSPIKAESVLDDCRILVEACGFLPSEFKECAFKFYEDVERLR